MATTEPLNLDQARARVATARQEIGEIDLGDGACGARVAEELADVADALLAELVQARADLASLGHWWCPNFDFLRPSEGGGFPRSPEGFPGSPQTARKVAPRV